MALEIGQVIDDKYRIVRLIGEGGMGSVYEGENVRIRRRVAIKILATAFATNTELVARFEREAQAAGQIGNDHILEVLDLGSLSNGERYMVLEYLDGETLLDRIRRLGRLTPQQIVPIARQFMSALDAAHAAGIIHRDLKPENIFILREKAGRPDFVKLIDFGISKFANLAPDAYRVTRAGTLIGTPSYMAPEQARGLGEADVRSDIYALGVILYEAVTGQLPFDGFASFNDLLFKIALSDPPPPSTHVPTLDPDFERIIMKAMARDSTRRYESVQELNDAVEEWANERRIPLSLQPPRTPRRVSIPEDVSQKRNAETQMETVTALPVSHRTEKMTLEPAIQSGANPAFTDSTIGVTRRPRTKVAIVAGALAGLLVVIGAAVIASRSGRAEPVGITPRANASEAPIADSVPAPPVTALPDEHGDALAQIPVPPPSASAKRPASPKPASSGAPKPGATGSAAPKASAKPGKPTAPDFGY